MLNLRIFHVRSDCLPRVVELRVALATAVLARAAGRLATLDGLNVKQLLNGKDGLLVNGLVVGHHDVVGFAECLVLRL